MAAPFVSAGGLRLRTPRRRSARIALQTSAIPHQREVHALRAHFAFVAFGLGFGAAFGGDGFGFGTCGCRLRPLHLLKRLRRREFLLGLDFQRRRAGGLRCRGEGSDIGRAVVAVADAALHHLQLVGARTGQPLRHVTAFLR
jgi:hypothetical protein